MRWLVPALTASLLLVACDGNSVKVTGPTVHCAETAQPTGDKSVVVTAPTTVDCGRDAPVVVVPPVVTTGAP